MRVLRRDVQLAVTPEQAYSRLYRDTTDSVWLDSGVGAVSGLSFVGSGISHVGDPFELLRNGPVTDEPCAPLGWIGWLGYELRGQTLGIPARHASRYPDAGLLWVDRGILFDHATGRVELVALGEDGFEEWASSVEDALRADTVVAPLDPSPTTATWRYTDDEYLAMVRACQVAIVEGEAYQLCLTSEASLSIQPDPLATYLALRASSETHHGALIRIGGVSLLSASPEQFLTVSRDGIVESKPIKGTRPRGVSVVDDDALRAELLASDKERADNLMIVDLMRNDIGRISEVGSVEVPSLLAIETYPHVHQLVSTVRGRLASGLSPVDAVAACFPAGSMTGAPKLRATQLLEGLEDRARGIYSGAFGYLAADGTVDLAMVIRSIVLDAVGATIGSGGGITALSVPEEELAEATHKAAALLRVLGA